MNTKRCLACKEEILEGALKCKYCHQVQTKIANLSNTPISNYLSLGLLCLFIIWIAYYIISFSIEEPLEPMFEIDVAEMVLTESDEGLNVRCIAQIINPSLKRWESFSLQATFKNTERHIVDILYSRPDVTIYPLFHFDGIVSGAANAAKDEYKSCELSVINADYY